jgi:hypothetical protein
MNNRSQLLKGIRPTIEIDNSKSTDLELFQSVSLRPILKLQNEVILSLINNFLAEHKVVVKNLTPNKKIERLHDIFKNNIQQKQLMLGVVIGHFTNDEIVFYNANKKETTKRIITMLLERVCSQLELLEF